MAFNDGQSASPAPPTPAKFSPLLPVPLTLSSLDKGWENLFLTEFRAETANEFDVPGSALHAFHFRMGKPFYASMKSDGKWQEGILVPDEFGVLPAGTPVQAQSLNTDPKHIFSVHVEPHWFRKIGIEAEAVKGEPQISSIFSAPDVQIIQLAMLLRAEQTGGCLSGALYTQSLTTALITRFLSRFSLCPLPLKEYRKGLGKSDLIQVLAYINDHLADDMSLDDFAALVHLSPYYFARLFKQVYRTAAPMSTWIQRRVQRTKELLLTGRLTIGELAQIAGFSDQSKLHYHFRRITGLTPAQFRKQ